MYLEINDRVNFAQKKPNMLRYNYCLKIYTLLKIYTQF